MRIPLRRQPRRSAAVSALWKNSRRVATAKIVRARSEQRPNLANAWLYFSAVLIPIALYTPH